jgi:uncharacterized membrane protein YdfJ with MMPL/SSD domain
VMAFAMGVGILLDTFLVRSALVPAFVVLFGRGARWPRRGLAVLPEEEDVAASEPLRREV